MKLLISVFFRGWLPALAAAALLAGCCGAKSCNCQTYPSQTFFSRFSADALFFRFSADSLGGTGFRSAEIATVLLVRSVYPRDSTAASKPDTVRLVRPRLRAFDAPIVIDNAEPFATANGRKLGYANPDSSYRYTIVLPGPRRNSPPLLRYYIGRVGLEGRYDGDGCCTCYENTRKLFFIRPSTAQPGQTAERVDATTARGNSPFVYELKR